MSLIIVHISDIHVRFPSDAILSRAGAVAHAAFEYLPQADAVFIVVSGDIAYSGKSTEYELASKLLRQIKQDLESEGGKPVTIITVPGNHDCSFELSTQTRQILVDHLAAGNQPQIDDSMIQTCTSVQKDYFDFIQQFGMPPCAGLEKLWRTERHSVAGKKIHFELLNVSWTSQLKEVQGRIFYPVERFFEKRDETCDLRISVMHHPLNWFGQASYRPFRTFIRRISDLLVTGHEHQGTVGIVDDAES